MGIQLCVELNDLESANIKGLKIEHFTYRDTDWAEVRRMERFDPEYWDNMGHFYPETEHRGLAVIFPLPEGPRRVVSILEDLFCVDNKNINHDILEFIQDHDIPYSRG